MKTGSIFLSLILGCACTACMAQTSSKKPVAPAVQAKAAKTILDEKSLNAARIYVLDALKAMGRADPIYPGTRARSIGAARLVLLSLDNELGVTEEIAKPAIAEKGKTPAKPPVARTQAEKISDSQTAMSAAQEELENAAKELAEAKNWGQTERGTDAVKNLQHAIEEAKASVAYFSKDKK